MLSPIASSPLRFFLYLGVSEAGGFGEGVNLVEEEIGVTHGEEVLMPRRRRRPKKLIFKGSSQPRSSQEE